MTTTNPPTDDPLARLEALLKEATIESLAADLQRVTKERDSLQQQLRQIRGTDQWRD